MGKQPGKHSIPSPTLCTPLGWGSCGGGRQGRRMAELCPRGPSIPQRALCCRSHQQPFSREGSCTLLRCFYECSGAGVELSTTEGTARGSASIRTQGESPSSPRPQRQAGPQRDGCSPVAGHAEPHSVTDPSLQYFSQKRPSHCRGPPVAGEICTPLLLPAPIAQHKAMGPGCSPPSLHPSAGPPARTSPHIWFSHLR